MRRQDIIDSKEQILEWIESNDSMAFMCRELKCKPDTLKRYFKLLDIEYAGNQGAKGKKTDKKKKTLIEYLETCGVPQNWKIKRKMFDEGFKERKCESCKHDTWLGLPISIEVHHIDGDHKNNKIENLQLLCPNCHAQTDNYRGKNKGSY